MLKKGAADVKLTSAGDQRDKRKADLEGGRRIKCKVTPPPKKKRDQGFLRRKK